MKKMIGIIGGMGPLATCDMFQKIVNVTDASYDQQHVHVCIDSNTEIADRTEAIIHHGKNPVPEMVKSAVRLQGLGADVLIMPCNTAHFFYEQIIPFVDIPFLNMIQMTADSVMKKGIHKIGLLATNGTIQSGVYEKEFSKHGIDVIVPSKESQVQVMKLIYDGVKANNTSIDTKGFQKGAEELLEAGAQILILGCTELPIAFRMFGFTYPNIDPTLVLASRAVQFVGAPVKEEMRY